MIYIYRILWLLFLIPVRVIEIIIFLLQIPLFVIAAIITFIICGDVEKTSDWFVPGRLVVLLDDWYRDLIDKF